MFEEAVVATVATDAAADEPADATEFAADAAEETTTA